MMMVYEWLLLCIHGMPGRSKGKLKTSQARHGRNFPNGLHFLPNEKMRRQPSNFYVRLISLIFGEDRLHMVGLRSTNWMKWSSRACAPFPNGGFRPSNDREYVAGKKNILLPPATIGCFIATNGGIELLNGGAIVCMRFTPYNSIFNGVPLK